jgi:hypothetical protein
LRRTLRIEITAFRRTTTLSGGGPDATAGEPDARLTERVPEGQNGGLNSADACSVQDKQIDVVEAICSSADKVPSRELTRLINAVVISNGDGSLAPQQVGLSRKRLYSRLRTLSSSIKNLITGFSSRIISTVSGLKSPRIK